MSVIVKGYISSQNCKPKFGLLLKYYSRQSTSLWTGGRHHVYKPVNTEPEKATSWRHHHQWKNWIGLPTSYCPESFVPAPSPRLRKSNSKMTIRESSPLAMILANCYQTVKSLVCTVGKWTGEGEGPGSPSRPDKSSLIFSLKSIKILTTNLIF